MLANSDTETRQCEHEGWVWRGVCCVLLIWDSVANSARCDES